MFEDLFKGFSLNSHFKHKFEVSVGRGGTRVIGSARALYDGVQKDHYPLEQ
jgi:hypothetical protein